MREVCAEFEGEKRVELALLLALGPFHGGGHARPQVDTVTGVMGYLKTVQCYELGYGTRDDSRTRRDSQWDCTVLQRLEIKYFDTVCCTGLWTNDDTTVQTWGITFSVGK